MSLLSRLIQFNAALLNKSN